MKPMSPLTPNGIRSPGAQWHHIQDARATFTWTIQDTYALCWNIGLLVVSMYMYLAGLLQTFQRFIQIRISSFLSNTILPTVCYVLLAAILWNVAQGIIKYYRQQPDFASMPLSPLQRKQLGLDPIDSSRVDADKKFVKPNLVAKLDQTSPLTRRVVPLSQASFSSPFASRTAPTPFQTPPVPIPSAGGTPVTPFTPMSAKSVGSPLSSYLIRRSPMGLSQEPIRDMRHLDALLGPKDGGIGPDTPHTPPAAFSVGAPFQPTPPQLGKFQPASRTLKGPAQPTQVRKENGLYTYEPLLVLQELNIEDYIEGWTEKMRKWMSSKILGPLVKRVDKIDSVFREANLSHLDTKTRAANLVGGTWVPQTQQAQPPAATGGFFSQPASTFGGASSMFTRPAGGAFGISFGQQPAQQAPAAPSSRPSSLEDLFAGYSRDATVQERMKLEKYLTVPGQPTNRLYILDRIRALARGGVLGAYQWTGGAEWEGKPWDKHKDLPSDLLLLMHLFATFMDETITPWDEYGRGEAFSRRHVTLFDPLSSDTVSSIQIRLADPNPPTLQLIVNYDTPQGAEKRGWQIFPKRNNLFHALVIFVYYIKATAGGFMGVVDLSSQSIGLSQVVEPTPSYSTFLSSLRQSRSSPQKDSTASPSAAPSSSNMPMGGSSIGTPLPNPFVPSPRSGASARIVESSNNSGGGGGSSSSALNRVGSGAKRTATENLTPYGTPTPAPSGFQFGSLSTPGSLSFK
ncbi:hypothetical protein SmJEL517_g00871 [Synchytrium microbalum]|uniref:Transmembrane protein 209 n=1 Tax=Synchytrium microbalum TaxID=1806994 RepID=A0A507CGY8_9FUNG|nr:uncharacterized protein SmJEL517_g00871 [Synchytrium microbalum]TPX36905.1 hypothetical protein SmJEL517_g00871 [Synchytrium microbalum]